MNQAEDHFERELKQAMQAVRPPEDFADRVMCRLEQSPAPARGTLLHMPQRWVAGALAASMLVGSAGTWAEREHRRRQQQEAERQFTLAMQVTSHALEQTRQQLSRAGFRLVDE